MTATNSVYINRTFNCSAQQLFHWMVKPELLAKWFGPNHLTAGVVESDLQVGGKYRIELLKDSGRAFFIEGQYLEIDEPFKLVFSFSYVGLPTTPPDSVVTIIIDKIEPSVSKLSFIQKFELTPTDMENRSNTWEKMLEKLNTQIRKSTVKNEN
ncbi:MAG: hypothetical protein COA58_10565 [Bacteroidetes bacterium]|nr:MAG: hypothetical protein COA58_10565 [Bacteroidota bacterium]